MSDSAISLVEPLIVYQPKMARREKQDGGSKTTRGCEPERKEDIRI
jgi:hypothetical protein